MTSGRASSLRDAALAFLCFAGLACALYAPSLLGGSTLLLRDLFTQFEGPRWLYRESLHSGELPYWNPFIACGVPFLANPQNSVLYPFSLVFAAAPFGTAISIFAALHNALLGFFSYLLARRLGLAFWGALLAGIVAGFAGIPVKQIEFPEMAAGFTWTPLVLLGAWECLTRPAPRSAALLGAALGLQLLAGSPYPPLYSCLGIGCAVLADLMKGRGRVSEVGVPGGPLINLRDLTPFLYIGLGLLFALLIGCAQYVPTLILVRNLPADRLSGVLEARFSLRLRDLLDFVSPWIAGYPNWQKCFYIGLSALFFAIVGLSSRRAPREPGAESSRIPREGFLLLVFLVVAGLVFAQADYLRLDRLVDALPLVRRSGKWPTLALSLSVLGLGLSCGVGLQRWIDRAGPAAARRFPIALVVAGLFTLACCFDALQGGTWLSRISGWLQEPMLLFRPSSMRLPAGAYSGEEMRLTVFGLVLALLILLRIRGVLVRWLPAAACLLVAAELITAGWSVNFQSPVDVYAEPPPAAVGELLGPGYATGSSRVFVPQQFDRFGDMVYGSTRLEEFRTLRGLYDQDTVMHWRVFTTQGGGTVPLPEYSLALQPVLDAFALRGTPEAFRLLGAWNISVILRGKMDATGFHCDLLDNRSVLPRVRLVEKTVGVPSESDALAAIAQGNWDPATAMAAWGQHVPEISPGTGSPGAVSPVDYSPAGIQVSCEILRPCLAVLSENWAEGWSATVDGSPAALYRVNFLQQAVCVQPGLHRIAWHYIAPGAHLGFLLAAIGIACIGLCASRPRC